METSDGHCNIALRKVQESGGGGSGCWLTSDLYLKIDIKVGLFFMGVVFLSLKATKSVI